MNNQLVESSVAADDTAIVSQTMQQAAAAFEKYKKITDKDRAHFLDCIAEALEARRTLLTTVAGTESHLPAARLQGELTRTTTQLKLFADLLREGSWVEASIDLADDTRTPKRADIRKMLVPIGPVIIFGASNFPFAFSTAGGDTASALASGSTIVIKGHPAHPATSLLAFQAIEEAIGISGMPQHTAQHVALSGNKIGKSLVMHPLTKGVGFTGSSSGGKALIEYAAQRPVPIPVFAEMSSINPVVFYPDILEQQATELATMYAASITLGSGQFCTKPGILLGLAGEGFDDFLTALGVAITDTKPQPMLHAGIHDAYENKLRDVLGEPGITNVGSSGTAPSGLEAQPLVAQISGADFLRNPTMKEELFGPFSLAVACENADELVSVMESLGGQLTTTAMATARDIELYGDAILRQSQFAGRISINQPPTGVEVCASMVHGGPFPATSDARFTSVGLTAIKRWVRPLCFQHFPSSLLPAALRNENSLGIMRIVNNEYTRSTIDV